MRKRLKRLAHSSVTAYVILTLAVGVSFARGQQINAQAQHRSCIQDQASWVERSAIVLELTKHTQIPRGTDIGISQHDLHVLIDNGNHAKDLRRANLLKLQGDEPQC